MNVFSPGSKLEQALAVISLVSILIFIPLALYGIWADGNNEIFNKIAISCFSIAFTSALGLGVIRSGR
jgi:hypothetical protein